MRFLIDASLPRSVADLTRRQGHDTQDVRDIGLGTAADGVIAKKAKNDLRSLITCDFDFADIRAYPPEDYPGIIVIERPENATVTVVLVMIERLLAESEIMRNISGRLVIVDSKRIRVRPALPEDQS